MAFPNFRSIIEAVVKPPIKALRCFYDVQVKLMLDRAAKQDEVIRDTQAMVAELNNSILKLAKQVLECTEDVHLIKSKMVPEGTVFDMSNYVRKNDYNEFIKAFENNINRSRTDSAHTETQILKLILRIFELEGNAIKLNSATNRNTQAIVTNTNRAKADTARLETQILKLMSQLLQTRIEVSNMRNDVASSKAKTDIQLDNDQIVNKKREQLLADIQELSEMLEKNIEEPRIG